MGVGGIFKFIFRRLFEIFVIAALLVLIPNLPPYATFSKPFTVTPPQPFTGKLSLNNRLENVEIWHKGDFLGPESFADLNGELYTSLQTGDIVKLTGEHITPVVKFGKPCKESYEESICGRPLGIEFDQNGYLYAADAYYGIFRVNVKTGNKEQLVNPNTNIEGRAPKIVNSITLASNGDIYWTDSSTDFHLEDGVYSFLADGTGRLIHYDAKTKKNTVLIDGLYFANGVALAEDEEFVIVAETALSRIHRYYLKGPKKGTSNVFIDGLPGLPDNLKADGKGGFLVPLVASRDADHPQLVQSIGPFPLIRKAAARFMGVTEYIFKKIDQLYPNEISLKAAHYIGHFTSIPQTLAPARVTLLRVNRNGQITDSVHYLGKKISAIAEMHVWRDTLYLGSPFNDYIARIPLAKLGWGDLQKDVNAERAEPRAAPKPTTTAKPATTTQRPTTTTTQKPTTTTQKPTTTTQKPTTTQRATTTTTQRPTTTTPRPTTTTQKPTTTPKPQTTTQKPVTTASPPKQQQQTVPPAAKQTAPPQQAKQTAPPQQAKQTAAPQQAKPTNPPPKQQTPPPAKQAPPQQQAAPKQAPPEAKQAPSQAQQQQQKQAPPPPKQQPKPAQANQK